MPKKPKNPPEGTSGDDSGESALNGTNKGDLILGLGGSDEISGKNGDDTLYGDGDDDGLPLGHVPGADFLNGGNGNDQLHGGEEDDTLKGGNGKDWLYGDEGNDTLKGGNGKDHLDGGAGNDDLYGGKGKDTFEFGLLFGSDTIFDFKDGKEKMDVSAAGLTLANLTFGVGVDPDDAQITTTQGVIIVKDAAGLIDESDFIFAA